ncbi:hypothetical protein L596_016138 [Steinernema carpocapsae]|uniref:Uncharacterized protein n=1 Tax=Steinernema carpocapsae TaxID=34508 RepID=A0A4U5NH37_STECR|nr:hypothetical protein L596_016138 [Steinernema carpocapsae]
MARSGCLFGAFDTSQTAFFVAISFQERSLVVTGRLRISPKSDPLHFRSISYDDIPYPVQGETMDVYQKFRDSQMFVAIKRSEEVSTTIVGRILEDIDTFLIRNAGREISNKNASNA